MDDLDRVFQRLVQNLKGRGGDALTAPFTVAELYEQLIPYRHNRRELGIETNQDYEIALTRLLSGERGYLIGDEKMQSRLHQEAGASNPDTGAFRDYATTQVSLAPDATGPFERGKGGAGGWDGATPTVPQKEFVEKPAPATPTVAAVAGAGAGTAAVAAAPPSAPPMPPRAAQRPQIGDLRAPEGCRYCSGTLPEGKPITFCPHCGQNLALHHCPACGAEIEQGWKFCIGCGRPTD